MKNGAFSDYKVFSGNSHTELAEEIASIMGKPLGKATVTKFSDGEISVNIWESVRGIDVYIVQPTCNPVNDNLMELLIMIDAMKRASAGRINAVLPYYGYARQDRKAKARDPITAKLVADLIMAAGADRVVTMDLHANQIQGYFNIPVDHLVGMPILARYFKEKAMDDVVVVSPDHGSVTRARSMAEYLNCPIAIVDKRRPEPNKSEIMNIIGNIEGKNCIIIDDMIDTAGTITNAANAIKDLGAKAVYACATHPVLSGPAVERIEKSAIEELVLLNTIPMPEEKKLSLIHISCCHQLGVSAETIIATLDDFTGTQRRFDIIGTTESGVRLVDDYAHHPTEIKATLSAAHNIPHRQLWCLFQPHTYTRTLALFDDFAEAFTDADVLILAEIYAAREKNIYKISSKELAEEIKRVHPEKKVYYMDTFEDIANYVRTNAAEGDLVITMGAGDIYKVGEMIIDK